MITCARYPFRLVTLIIGLIGIIGCTQVIKNTDIPELQTGSPLESVRPKTFAFKEFKDVRGTDKPLLINIRLDQPAAEIVATGIRKELQRNGHICIDYSMQLKADFIIEGTVYKYSHKWELGHWTTKRISNVAVKLTISITSTDGAPLIKYYEGESFDVRAYPGLGPKDKEILIQAQTRMLREFSTDFELIAFLNK